MSSQEAVNLRAAIAREEARPPATTDGERRCWEGLVEEWRKGHDEQKARAQQAEASAAWWKAEGERLSAELALAKNQMTLAIERSERLSGQLRGCEYDLGQTGKLRNRAEKAETELAIFRGYFAKAHSISDTLTAAEAVSAAQGIIDRDAGQLARLGHSTPMDFGKVLPQVVDDLLLRRAEMVELRRINTALEEQRNQFADTAGLGRKFATERDLLVRVEEAEAQLKLVQKQCGVERTEVERLRKANRELQEQNWDLRTPDFPMLAEPPLHLHYAYMPGDWSHKADEWFTYSRLMRNGHPTKMVRVGWRHGPGIPNSDPSVPRAAKGYAGVIERLRTAEMELARLRADAFADDCKALLEGKDAKVVSVNAYSKCAFKFDEPKPVPPFEGDPKACAFKPLAFPEERGCDLHALLENAGVPGVSTNVAQMSLAERIGWLVGEWKLLRDLVAKAKSDTRAKIQSELRSIERALCSVDVLNKFAGLSRGAYECHVHNTIETAISALRDDAATPPYATPFEGDPKACAFKPLAFPEEPKPLPVEPRDPVTGWTFRDYAAELEAAYTVARGNACLLAEALKVKGATK